VRSQWEASRRSALGTWAASGLGSTNRLDATLAETRSLCADGMPASPSYRAENLTTAGAAGTPASEANLRWRSLLKPTS